MRRSSNRQGCDCRVSMLDIERILQEVGLSTPSTVNPFSANRIRGIAGEVGVKVRPDRYGRESVTRDEAVSIVDHLRAQRQANIDEQHAAAVAAAKYAADAKARGHAAAAAAAQAETERLVAQHGERARHMTWIGRSTLQ